LIVDENKINPGSPLHGRDGCAGFESGEGSDGSSIGSINGYAMETIGIKPFEVESPLGITPSDELGSY
jgi:hypothetical protein